MTTIFSLRITVAATLVCAGSFSVSAQGLGGFLNKAKEKVNQASSASPGQAVQKATQTANQKVTYAVQGTDGELPPQPRDYTDVDMQDWYTRTVLANTRPYDDHDNSKTNDDNIRKAIHRHPPFPAITWDRPVLEFFASQEILMIDYINDWCGGFDMMLAKHRPQLVYIEPHFKKIKEIHYSTTQTVPTRSETMNDGFVKSWDPATGVLTLSVCTKPGYTPHFNTMTYSDNNVLVEDWIIKNVR